MNGYIYKKIFKNFYTKRNFSKQCIKNRYKM